MSMNQLTIIGNLTRDPEMRQTADGKTVCTFTLAVNRRGRDAADFFRVSAWNQLGEICYQYLAKGRKAAVVGMVSASAWQGQDGKAYARGDMEQPLPVALPENGEREMVMATRPNQIDMNRTEGYKTKVEKRIFLTNYTEYLVRVGDQLLQVQTPHRNAFAQGETCYLKFPGIMWYGREDEQAEAERNRRQLV